MSDTSGRYTWVIKDGNNNNLISWTGNVAKVSDVDSFVNQFDIGIKHNGEPVAAIGFSREGRDELVLYRYPDGDLLADPVTKRVA